MQWIPLTTETQLDEIVGLSASKPVVIFKHSTRCSISSTALSRLERARNAEETPAYYLDLITYRPISSAIAEKFAVVEGRSYVGGSIVTGKQIGRASCRERVCLYV